MKYSLVDASIDDIDYLKQAKSNIIYTYANNLKEEEKNEINNYIDTSIPKELKEYKIILFNNKTIGCLLIKKQDDGVLLDEIYLEESYRNLGIGTEIIKNILDINNIVYLWVYKENKKAVSLYKRLSFIIIDETESRYYMKYKKSLIVEFKVMTLEENIDLVKYAYKEKDKTLDMYKYVTSLFPELKEIKKDLDINKQIEDIVNKRYYDNFDLLNQKITEYTNIWNKYNDIYLKSLSEYFDISNLKVSKIIANVGIIPIFPRYLDTCSFSIGIVDEEKLIETTSHEILHFFWFEKWKEMFPNYKKEEFETPNLIWKYSEMVVDPILNSKDFNDIFKINYKAYDSFYELYDGELKVMDKLKEIYNKNINISQKMLLGYEYIKKLNI